MYKQVIVVRRDLRLSKGKLAVSASHASLEAYKKASLLSRKKWERIGVKKIVLHSENLDELIRMHEKAKKQRLPCSLIRDAGKTEVKPGTITALGIGPAESKKIDKVTGKLKIA